MNTTDNTQVIVDTATRAALGQHLEPGKIYAFNTPAGVKTVELTGPEYTGIPARKSGTTTVRDTPSFLAYFGKHADSDSEIYADSENLTVTAVLDAHQANAPRWSGHRLTLALRRTEAWAQWLAGDGKLLSQEQFAEFLEDHIPELLEPSAAEMLEIAQSIQAVNKVDFQSGTRLASGQRQFQYVETTTAKAGQKGQLTIPETFVIGLVPFEGAQGYRLTARLRYRLGGGELRMGYKLEQPANTLRTAFGDVLAEIAEKVEQPVMNGTSAR